MNFRRLISKLTDVGHSLDSKFSKRDDDNIVLKQSSVWMKSVTWALMGTSVLGMTWLTFAKTEEVVTVKGKLEPIGRVKDVQIPIGGVATEILVTSGQSVKKGQVLIKLDETTSKANLDSVRVNLENKEIQLADKKEQMELKNEEQAEIENLTTSQIQIAETDLILQNKILGSYTMLVKEGSIPNIQYLDQKNKVAQLKSEIIKVKIEGRKSLNELKQTKAQLHGEIAGLQGEVEDLKAKLTEAEVNFGYRSIVSPVDGVVFDLKPTTTGYVAQSSEPVMKVVPFGSLQARVEIPSNKIGFVHTGQKSSISIDSFPSSDFGVLNGKLEHIGSDALVPDQSKGRKEYAYPATIKLRHQKLELKRGPSLPLQAGMSVTANIKLRHVSYLQLLLGSFRDKTDSLNRL